MKETNVRLSKVFNQMHCTLCDTACTLRQWSLRAWQISKLFTTTSFIFLVIHNYLLFYKSTRSLKRT